MDEILFISDCHLSGDDTKTAQLLRQFLLERASTARALYILGDLFEVWVGDDDPALEHQAVLATLRQVATNTKVSLLVGNRDFLIGSAFADSHSISLLQEPVHLTLGQSRTVLLHGDTLCTDDQDYQEFRTMVRKPSWQNEFLNKPLAERQAIAAGLRKDSKAAMREKSDDTMDVNQQAVTACFADNQADVIIHGHTHRPARHDYADNKTRFVLGDWSPGPSYLSWTAKAGFKLSDFRFNH